MTPIPKVDIGALMELRWTECAASGEVTMVRVHAPERCEAPCAFHSPSDHPLAGAPMGHVHAPIGLVWLRKCEHGYWHPDPDWLAFARRVGVGGRFDHDCCDHDCCGGVR